MNAVDEGSASSRAGGHREIKAAADRCRSRQADRRRSHEEGGQARLADELPPTNRRSLSDAARLCRRHLGRRSASIDDDRHHFRHHDGARRCRVAARGRLKTEFDQGAFVDTFYVREPPYLDGPGFETQFKLRRGLVASLTSVVYADTAANLSVAGQYTDVTATVQAARRTRAIRVRRTYPDALFPPVRADQLPGRLRRRPKQCRAAI